MIRRSMTYGVLPTRDEFVSAWEDLQAKGELGETFDVSRDPYAGTDSWSCQELWKILLDAQKEYTRDSNEKAGDFCSSVLGIFGFEWV